MQHSIQPDAYTKRIRITKGVKCKGKHLRCPSFKTCPTCPGDNGRRCSCMWERPKLLHAPHALEDSSTMSESKIWLPRYWLPPENYEVSGRRVDGEPVYYCTRKKDKRAAKVQWSDSMCPPTDFDGHFSASIGEKKEP
jgi:hypothetical protein